MASSVLEFLLEVTAAGDIGVRDAKRARCLQLVCVLLLESCY